MKLFVVKATRAQCFEIPTNHTDPRAFVVVQILARKGG